jgi:hypothetical protein
VSDLIVPDAGVVRDFGKWSFRFLVEKYWADEIDARLAGRDVRPYEVVETDNQFMNGGISVLWQCLIGNGSGTAGGNLTFFNNANAAIGTGDSSTAEVQTHNDLQATTNKLRVGMNSTYPQHSDSTAASARDITFQATFATAQANWQWRELAIFNSSTSGTGRMLNRKVAAGPDYYGTKTNLSAWLVTGIATIS